MRRFFSTLFKKQGGVYTPLRVLDLDGDAGAGGLGLATPTAPGLMSAADKSELDAIAPDQFAKNTSDVSLSSDASTSVLAVTLTGLGASKTYACKLGIRIRINTTGTPANTGYVDIVTLATIATNGSSVASVLLPLTISPDVAAPSAIAAITGTVSASTGGFTVYATRVSGVAQVAFARAWVITLDEVS